VGWRGLWPLPCPVTALPIQALRYRQFENGFLKIVNQDHWAILDKTVTLNTLTLLSKTKK
jgi:hypothetical protein